MVFTYKRGLSSEQDLVDGSPSRSEDMANKIECYIFGILLQLPNRTLIVLLGSIKFD